MAAVTSRIVTEGILPTCDIRRYGRLQLKPQAYERRYRSGRYVLARTALPGSLLRHRLGGEDPATRGIDGGSRWRQGLMGRCSEEDDMSDTAPALDEAFERMAAASFELPNGFVNHGVMACEAPA